MVADTHVGRDALRRDRGQSLIWVAMLMTVLFGFLALAIDIGQLYTRRRQMQNAADAGALAGLRALGKSQDAHAAAVDYAQRNGAQQVLVDVDSGSGIVGVTAIITFPTFVAGVWGADELKAGADAGAQLGQCGEYVIWADSPACDEWTIQMSGSDMNLEGKVHSNNDAEINGSNNTVTDIFEYVDDWAESGSGNVVDEVALPAALPRPITFIIDDYAPEGGTCVQDAIAAGKYHQIPGDLIIDSANQELDGLYYVEGDVTVLSGSEFFGKATIVTTGWIDVAGSEGSLEAYCDDLLFFSDYEYPGHDDRCVKWVIKLPGSENDFKGIIYAPHGQVEISGQNTHLTGSIIAWTVKLNGSDSLAIQQLECEASSRLIY